MSRAIGKYVKLTFIINKVFKQIRKKLAQIWKYSKLLEDLVYIYYCKPFLGRYFYLWYHEWLHKHKYNTLVRVFRHCISFITYELR